MATEADVRRAALALPGVVERPSWGNPAWFAATLMARIWEEGVLWTGSVPRNWQNSSRNPTASPLGRNSGRKTQA
ncbi:hypothetical protein [Arthrobacter sp. AL12]|uniref:hypothetical protein n=1 Tax=Arthrobacter sp. AL12 TaxID=3042241 RepID=UPI00249CEBE3|nr:hypothetical protein [Arthrobacter sp. AL12]MDI3213181.1 hypothetical protein [Arthrobacter sp. AL12]